MDMKTKKSVLEVYLMEGLQPVDQVPLCDTHQRDSIERVKGSIREIAVSGGRVEGTLCLDPTEESAWSKIRNRHVTDVSAGFQPVESMELKPGQIRTIAGRTFAAPADRSLSIHTKWRLREVSVTPIGSDEQAKIRTMSDRASGGLFDEHGRFNPNHDEAGRFAESGSGAADKASKAAEKAGKGARQRGRQAEGRRGPRQGPRRPQDGRRAAHGPGPVSQERRQQGAGQEPLRRRQGTPREGRRPQGRHGSRFYFQPAHPHHPIGRP